MGQSEDELALARARVGGPYAWYVLGILILIYATSFVNRQILSILAEDIKADLGITDAQMGFLYGTVFAVFYALFGIPLGRLADMWHRVRLLSLGLTLWAMMTALSGFARNFGELAVARIGVGIGQAAAAPSAFSILADYFPREKRATAISIYASGVSIGMGLSLFLGGLIVNNWNAAFPEGGPLGLVGWQAAFVIVGAPGVLLAAWFATAKEPIRGISEGIVMPPTERPFAKMMAELVCIIPPFTIFHIAGFGRRALLVNLAGVAVAAAAAFGISHLVGNLQQWLALAVAGYAVFTWQQSLAYRDAPTHHLIWGTPTFLVLVVAFGSISMVLYAWGFWSAPYAIRVLGADKAAAGLFLGITMSLGGFLSVISGGRMADWLSLRNPSGGILVAIVGLFGMTPFLLLQFTTSSETLFYVWSFGTALLAGCWGGVAGATFQDLVLPRMRGAATATYLLGVTVIGLGIGPFLAGFLSERIGHLGHALLAMMLLLPLPLLCLIYVYRTLPAAKASRVERARAAGEQV